MSLLSTRSMENRVLRTKTKTNEVVKHHKMQMILPNTRTRAKGVDKHINNDK
jgi:hypothetical protein